ncbi:hypothetical protein [Mesorhizobium temperatum]|nr:hypothetical protein [Mesorhizobium temperatum]
METVNVVPNRSARLTGSLPRLGPLSPDEFQAVSGLANGDPSMEMSTTTDDQTDILTGSDRISLQVFLNLLRSSKVEAKSPDAEVAKRGKQRLVVLISYLAGFLDARGLLPKAATDSGFDLLIVGNMKPDMNLLLDELEADLVTALTTETRGRVGQAIKEIGWDMVKTGLITEALAWAAPK